MPGKQNPHPTQNNKRPKQGTLNANVARVKKKKKNTTHKIRATEKKNRKIEGKEEGSRRSPPKTRARIEGRPYNKTGSKQASQVRLSLLSLAQRHAKRNT